MENKGCLKPPIRETWTWATSSSLVKINLSWKFIVWCYQTPPDSIEIRIDYPWLLTCFSNGRSTKLHVLCGRKVVPSFLRALFLSSMPNWLLWFSDGLDGSLGQEHHVVIWDSHGLQIRMVPRDGPKEHGKQKNTRNVCGLILNLYILNYAQKTHHKGTWESKINDTILEYQRDTVHVMTHAIPCLSDLSCWFVDVWQNVFLSGLSDCHGPTGLRFAKKTNKHLWSPQHGRMANDTPKTIKNIHWAISDWTKICWNGLPGFHKLKGLSSKNSNSSVWWPENNCSTACTVIKNYVVTCVVVWLLAVRIYIFVALRCLLRSILGLNTFLWSIVKPTEPVGDIRFLGCHSSYSSCIH